jgi:hypothetical protein
VDEMDHKKDAATLYNIHFGLKERPKFHYNAPETLQRKGAKKDIIYIFSYRQKSTELQIIENTSKY